MTVASDSPLGVALDTVGAETLERMASAPAYNRWMFNRLSGWMGSRVLEIGSGLGNMSQFFVRREGVVLTDTEPAYLEALRRRFGAWSNVEIVEMALPNGTHVLTGRAFDTIVCLNVLEHIEDDRGALQAMHDLLHPGGHLVLLVPAMPALFGSLDRALGHHRRYTREMLRSRYKRVGLHMSHIEYFNLAGTLGWWFTGRVLQRDLIPRGSLRLYDALVPLFRLERLLPFRFGQSLIAIGERPA